MKETQGQVEGWGGCRVYASACRNQETVGKHGNLFIIGHMVECNPDWSSIGPELNVQRDIKAEHWLYSVWQRYRCEQCSYSLTKKKAKWKKKNKFPHPRKQRLFIKNCGLLGVRPANSWGDDWGGDTEQVMEQKCLQQKVFIKNKPGTALAGFKRSSTRNLECPIHIITHRRFFITYNTAKDR